MYRSTLCYDSPAHKGLYCPIRSVHLITFYIASNSSLKRHFLYCSRIFMQSLTWLGSLFDMHKWYGFSVSQFYHSVSRYHKLKHQSRNMIRNLWQEIFRGFLSKSDILDEILSYNMILFIYLQAVIKNKTWISKVKSKQIAKFGCRSFLDFRCAVGKVSVRSDHTHGYNELRNGIQYVPKWPSHADWHSYLDPHVLANKRY